MFRQANSPAPTLPLLITGVAGVPGYNAWRYFSQKYPGQVIGIRQHDNWRLEGPGIVACNAEDRIAVEELFDRHEFGSVLDSAGVCALKSCELNPEMAWRVNVAGAENLVETAVARNVRLVHLSVDLVFSGERDGGHVEDDPTDPVTMYGKTMVAAEESILARMAAACILRISLPMGVSFNGHAGAIDWIQSRFKKSKPATLFYDEVRTPTYTDCLNRLYETMLSNDLAGIYHAGGQRAMTLYEIAQVINRAGGYDPKCLMGCLRSQAGPMPPRAGNVAMNCDKLVAALDYHPLDAWPWCESLVPTHDAWHHDRPTDWPGSPAFLAQVLYRNPARTSDE